MHKSHTSEDIASAIQRFEQDVKSGSWWVSPWSILTTLEGDDGESPEQRIASEFNTLRGRVLGLIESWNLPESQERGAKSTFKSLTYDAEREIKALIPNEPCD